MAQSLETPGRTQRVRICIAPIVAYAAMLVGGLFVEGALLGLRHVDPFIHLHPRLVLGVAGVLRIVQAIGAGGVVTAQVAEEAAMLSAVAWWLRGYFSRSDLGLGRFSEQDIGYGLLAFFVLYAVTAITGIMLSAVHISDRVPAETVYILHMSAAWQPVVIALCAGIAEEITFRGYLLQGLRRLLPRQAWLAVLIESLLFAAYHLGWGLTAGAFLVFTVFGLVQSVLALRGGLYRVIIAHAAYDVVASAAIMHLR